MNDIFSNAPKIIEDAAKSQLGLFALMILITGVLGFYFFKKSSEVIKLTIFIPMLSGVFIFGYGIFQKSSTLFEVLSFVLSAYKQ